ncbi:MAG: SDR family oxidoreductase [Cyclobacteriaceae bacterium]
MLLVTAASGKLGSLVVENLKGQLPPGEELVVSSRHPEQLEDLAKEGIEIREAAYDDKNSMIKAFRGVRKALFISGYAPNEERMKQHRNVIGAAVLAGVKHLCYTSFVNATELSRFMFADVHRHTEDLLQHSGLTYTIVRNAWYADLLLEDIEQTLENSRLEAAAGEGKINSIPRIEIAHALARIMSESGHGNTTYELTGPETFSYEQAAEWLSEAFDQSVKYVESNSEKLRKLYGGDSPYGYEANAILSSYEAMKYNEYDFVTDDFEKIMGRKPMSVRDFIMEQSKEMQT